MVYTFTASTMMQMTA